MEKNWQNIIVVLSVLIFYVTINLKQKTMHQQKVNAIKITKIKISITNQSS